MLRGKLSAILEGCFSDLYFNTLDIRYPGIFAKTDVHFLQRNNLATMVFPNDHT